MTLRDLPSVEEVLRKLDGRFPHALAVAETRRVLDEARTALRSGIPVSLDFAERVASNLAKLRDPSLKRVINATGVVLHTNLGRAPLTPIEPIRGYSNLEYDLTTGRRGKRDVHAAKLLEHLLEAPGIVVNNNAAAVYLVLNELAANHEVVVSRGELIEIGDGFRIPDIMARSGAVLREVGTTNRSTIDDYRNAITDRTRILMRVHPSNFRIEGFTAKPGMEELAELARERQLILYEDLGSGCLVDLRAHGVTEPLAKDSLKAGAGLISFSGDKLLGGPQAGIIAGRPELVQRIRKNPMFRALRVDKLIYQALETTLRTVLMEDWNSIPALRMIQQSAEVLQPRAQRIAEAIGGEVIPGKSVIGGGSTPAQSLPTWLVALDRAVETEQRLRAGDPPVVARIEDGRLLIDLRTVAADEEAELIRAVQLARS